MRSRASVGDPLPQEQLDQLTAPKRNDGPRCHKCGTVLRRQPGEDFQVALHFILNQYDFIAAGVRDGTMDWRLISRTIRKIVLDLGLTSEDYIRHVRSEPGSEGIWENFVWLHREFGRKDPKYRDLNLDPAPCEAPEKAA